MKKAILILTMLIGMISLQSCGNPDVEKLEKFVNEIDSQCPFSMGMLGEMKSATYDKDANVVRLVVANVDELFTNTFANANSDFGKQSLKASYSNPESKEMLELMVNAGASMEMVYEGANESYTIALSNSELKDVLENPISEEEADNLLLQSQIEFVNSSCPIETEPGIVSTGVVDEGGNIIYKYRVDENMYSMSTVEDIQNQLRSTIQQSIVGDIGFNRLCQLIARANKGLLYQYYGSQSGDTVDISFSNDELRSYTGI